MTGAISQTSLLRWPSFTLEPRGLAWWLSGVYTDEVHVVVLAFACSSSTQLLHLKSPVPAHLPSRPCCLERPFPFEASLQAGGFQCYHRAPRSAMCPLESKEGCFLSRKFDLSFAFFLHLFWC